MVRCVGHVVVRRVPYRLGSPPPTRKNTSLQGSCGNKKWPLLDGGRAHKDAGWCVLLAGRGSTRLRGGVGSYGSGGTGRRATTRGSGTPRVGSIDAPRQALSPEMRRTATGSVPGGLGFVLSGTNCDCYPVVLGAATL
ncbi:hypothetical protein PGQ11_014818 [Apiospora arundinis]|uniref:Uncharacterized protein n=1 Tax=Apiospora arundinis TaxID=335852 RepID=A0ABR2HK47_9PEZI